MLLLYSPKSRYRTFPSPQKFPSYPFLVIFPHLFQRQRLFGFFPHGLVLSIIEIHMDKIVPYVFLCVWLFYSKYFEDFVLCVLFYCWVVFHCIHIPVFFVFLFVSGHLDFIIYWLLNNRYMNSYMNKDAPNIPNRSTSLPILDLGFWILAILVYVKKEKSS